MNNRKYPTNWYKFRVTDDQANYLLADINVLKSLSLSNF